MNRIRMMLIAVGSLLPAVCLSQQVTCREDKDADGNTTVVLENQFVRLTFSPHYGGRATSCYVKATKRELCYGGEYGGLFVDHWSKFPWPSALFELPYQYDLPTGNDQQRSIHLWVTAEGKKLPKASNAHDDPGLLGLRVEKIITLFADRPTIHVKSGITNPTKEARNAGLYMQHCFYLGGDYDWETYYRPSTTGVEVMRVRKSGEANKGKDWVREPTAGWTAARDDKTNDGLVFVLDYNYLRELYNSGATTEWFLDPVVIPASGQWWTEYVVVPVKGFRGFTYSSRRLIADLSAQRTKDGLQVTHTVASSWDTLGDVKLKTSILTLKDRKPLAAQETLIKGVGFDPRSGQVVFKGSLQPKVVLRTEASGDGWTESYESFFDSTAVGLKTQENMGMAPLAVTGSAEDTYSIKRPRKIKQFNKPDFNSIPKAGAGRLKLLLMYGLYTQTYRIDEALKPLGVELKISDSPDNGAEYFPGTYDELFSYHAVILSDVHSKALGDVALEMLSDYVANGGGVLWLGGPGTYGHGEFEETAALNILPVNLLGGFDMKWEPKGWELTPAASNHPILSGVTFAQHPMAYWVHRAEAKKNATVVLNAGSQPGLVVQTIGKGRVAAFMPGPLGEAKPAQTEFWGWEGWTRLVRNAVTWVTGREPAQ